MIQFTKAEDAFILENADIGCTQLARELTNRFGIHRRHGVVATHCEEVLGITLKNNNRQQYTKEQIDFLRDNKNVTLPELASMFNEHFNANVTRTAIEHICSRENIFKERKGIKMLAGKRNPFTKRCKIGTERSCSGKVYIKISDNVTKSGENSFKEGGNWQEKKRFIYEKHNGKIPKGYQVIHLDGNKGNFSPNNLYAISPKTNMVLAANKWFTNDREVTLTAIKWCELFYALLGKEDLQRK